MSSNRIKRTILSSLAVVAVLGTAVAGNLYRQNRAYAGGGHATNPGFSASGGQCGFKKNPVPAYAWFDYCIGATWMYFSFDETYTGITVDKNTYTATIANASHMPGGKIGPCAWEEEVAMTEQDKKDFAAENPGEQVPSTKTEKKHTSGFFRLGLVVYNPATFLTSKNILNSLTDHSSYGPLAGLLANNSLQEFAGDSGVPYLQTTHSTSLSFNDAHQKYNEAVSSGKLLSDSLVAWDSNLGGFCYDTSWSGGGIGITNSGIKPPTKPPVVGPPTQITNENGGHFYSQSTVTIDAQAHDVSHHQEQSSPDGSVSVKLSTDNDKFTGTFHHNITWMNDQRQGRYGAPATQWSVSRTIERTSGGSGSQTLTSGNTYQVPEALGGTESTSDNLNTSSFTVTNLVQGETVKVCDTIKYSPKYISYTAQSGSTMHTWTGGDGEGSSTACFEITRPKEPTTIPTGDNHVGTNPKSNGDPDGSIVYAGETADVKWDNIWAEGYPARRYAEYREIVFTVVDTQDYRDTRVTGNNYSSYSGIRRDNRNPCDYYRDKAQDGSWPATTGCTTIDMHTANYSGSAVNGGSTLSQIGWNTNDSFFTNSRTVNATVQGNGARAIIPNYVGYKYCNSAGWRFEYWVGVEKDGTTTWHKESKDYWVTSNAACRTVAKKPSVATWNGSQYSLQQNMIGVTSSRYLGDLYPGLNSTYANASYGGNNQLYGSWAEYQLINGLAQIKTYSSGAAFAKDSGAGDYPNWSTLSIRNNNQMLGFSEINKNETLYTRLDTYLKNKATLKEGNQTASSLGLGLNIEGTKIFHVTGNLDIDQDIVLRTNDYDNIYQLPRVVLFVDGNVTVRGNVTQVDAWLIINGKINTCSDFVDASKGGGNYSSSSYGTSADTYNQSGTKQPGDYSATCSKQLSFNGPVMVGGVNLNRNYGSDIYIYRNGAYAYDIHQNVSNGRDTNYYRYASAHPNIVKSERYTPAEIFNYRADDYLWAYAQAGRYYSSYTESYSRELAPRY